MLELELTKSKSRSVLELDVLRPTDLRISMRSSRASWDKNRYECRYGGRLVSSTLQVPVPI
jgi:hypothetical protein